MVKKMAECDCDECKNWQPIPIFRFEDRKLTEIKQEEGHLYPTQEDVTCQCGKHFLIQVLSPGFIYCPYCEADLGICII